jgi:hypothetical protein
LQWLAGHDGGHAKHLARHILCFHTQYDGQPLHPVAQVSLTESHEDSWELGEAQDVGELDYSTAQADKELLEMVRNISNNEY